MVVERRGLQRAFAIEHGQWAEAAGFVDVAAIAVVSAFGDETFALPQEFGGVAIDGFGDAAAKGVVFVARDAATRQADADQTMLAVVTVLGDQFLPGAAAFADQVAVRVVVVMTVALHQQTVAFDVGEVGGRLVVLAEEVACRVVSEAFRRSATYADQSVKRVVVVAAVAFAAVVDAGEVAVGVVGVAALEQILFALADAVCLQPTLFVVLVLAEQQPLLALLFATGVELVVGQAGAVEVDAAQLAARLVAVVELAAVRQPAVLQLADAVVLVAQGAPALVFGDQAILQVVFVGEGPVAVVDVDEATEGVVAVVNFFAVSQCFHQQAASSVALVLGHQFAAVVTELGFLQQPTVEVVFVGGAATVEAGFLLDQTVRVVVEVVVLAAFVFNLGEQQARVVVAVAQLAAVGVDAAAHEVQVVGVFVAGDAPEFIPFGGDATIRVIGEGAGGAAGKGDLCQAINDVPLVMGDGPGFILTCDLPT